MRNSFCTPRRAVIGMVLAGGSLLFGCSSNRPSFVSASDQPGPASSGHHSSATASRESSQPAEPSPPTVAANSAGPAVLASPTAARSVSYADIETITTSDVIRWTSRGVREDVILERVERSPSVFHLTAADENHLRDKGVTEIVIQEMKATARR